MTFTSFNFFLSTAEEERDLFSGQFTPAPPRAVAALPAGVYRVVDGELFRIVPGTPFGIPPRHTA
jgi:hypothetical protein